MRTPFETIRPSGRKVTPDRVRYAALAEQAKLGTVQRSELSLLAQALPCTGLVNSTEALLLKILIDTTPKDAFEKNGQPVVFKSNRQLAFELNRSESRISFLLSRLFDAGLITMQDSGNYKRYSGRQLDSGSTDACGINLRILVSRYAELADVVREARREQAANQAAKRRYRGSVRMILNLMNCIEAVSGPLDRRVQRIIDLVGKPGTSSSSILKRATALLERLAKRMSGISADTSSVSDNDNSVCLSSENNKHIQNTNPYQTVISNDERRSAAAEQHNLLASGSASKWAYEKSLSGNAEPDKAPNELADSKVALQDLLRAVPVITQTWGLQINTWADLVRSVPDMAVLAGISPDARDRAIQQMGKQAAAVAIAVTLQKQDMQEVTSPGGYLRAMTDRAAAGTLRLSRSVYALANRRAPGAAA